MKRSTGRTVIVYDLEISYNDTVLRYTLLKPTRVVNSWSNTVTETDHFLFLSDWIVMDHRMISRLCDNWAIAAYFLLWPILSDVTFSNSYSCHISLNFLRDRSTINFIWQDRNYRNLSNNVVKVRLHRTSKRHAASASSVWLFRDSSRENDRATTGHGVIYLTTLYTTVMFNVWILKFVQIWSPSKLNFSIVWIRVSLEQISVNSISFYWLSIW